VEQNGLLRTLGLSGGEADCMPVGDKDVIPAIVVDIEKDRSKTDIDLANGSDAFGG